MSKTIQLPVETFLDLVRVHLLDQDDPDALERIRKALETKLDAMIARETYSQYKDAELSPEAREKARQKYLDLKGITTDFRW